MAGNYPDVPGFRFEYDRDGSVVMWDGTATATLGQMQAANDEGWGNSGINAQSYFGVAWPELRDLTGICLVNQYGVTTSDEYQLKISTNTTNSTDGTWTILRNVPANVLSIDPGVPDFCRRNIVPITGATNIRGIQLWVINYRGGTNTGTIHVYGTWPSTQNPDRLILCNGSGAEVTNGAYFDFGDAPRSTQATIPFRIKNHSSAFTANSITVSFECLSNTTPSLLTQFDFSTNGGASYVTSQNIGNLGPGATTPQYLLRRNTAAGAATGPWQLRLLAIPASMT
jgi:hypothetical protein